MADVEISVTIPDKEPFEGKATQKQKQYIWDLGYQDEEAISDLGKKQASAIIEQLKTAHEHSDQATDGLATITLSVIVLVICGIAILGSDNAFIEFVAYAVGLLSCLKLAGGMIKTWWHKWMIKRNQK